MSEPQQQYGKRWDELSPDEQKGGYWLAIPDDPDDVMDQMEYEVVLVTYNGQRIVYRPGMQFPVLCGTLRFLYRLDLPETAAEVMAQDDRERHRKSVEAAVEKAGREMADESFVFPTGGDVLLAPVSRSAETEVRA